MQIGESRRVGEAAGSHSGQAPSRPRVGWRLRQGSAGGGCFLAQLRQHPPAARTRVLCDGDALATGRRLDVQRAAAEESEWVEVEEGEAGDAKEQQPAKRGASSSLQQQAAAGRGVCLGRVDKRKKGYVGGERGAVAAAGGGEVWERERARARGREGGQPKTSQRPARGQPTGQPSSQRAPTARSERAGRQASQQPAPTCAHVRPGQS